jgi:hypothetical protein
MVLRFSRTAGPHKSSGGARGKLAAALARARRNPRHTSLHACRNIRIIRRPGRFVIAQRSLSRQLRLSDHSIDNQYHRRQTV